MSRSILITGATNGFGRAAAQALASEGHHVVVHGRNAGRVRRTVAAIRRAAPAGVVDGVVADLSRQADVQRLAEETAALAPRLTVLVHNAAIVPLTRELTADGFEMQFAVNHLASFALTYALLPTLVRNAPSRIVIVASQLERKGRLDFDDLQSVREYDSSSVYCNTKLANVLFAAELARRLEGSGVTANSLHPGIAGTGVLNALRRKPRWFAPVTRAREPRPEAAVASIVQLAAGAAVEGVTGAYFQELTQQPPSLQAQDTALAERLWAASAGLLSLPTNPPTV